MTKFRLFLVSGCTLGIAIAISLMAFTESRIKTFTVNGVSFSMVEVDGGSFTMGATAEQSSVANDDEKPAHKVTLSKFSISQTEVTQQLWEAVMGTNPSQFKGKNRPVEGISRADCDEFLKKLSKLTGKKFRLPTEAEWEFAARGGTKSRGFKYSGSNKLDDVAWFAANSFAGIEENNSNYGTHDVAKKQPNELGLYDMSGNVWEFCQDVYCQYKGNDQKNPVKKSRRPTTDTEYVDRGGSWNMEDSFCRISYRDKEVVYGKGDTGIRLAMK